MINEKSGEIIILENDMIIKPSVKRPEVLSSKFFKGFFDRENDMKNGYRWYYFKPISICNRNIRFYLCFHNEELDSVHFCEAGVEFPLSWEDWSESAEIKRKLNHDHFLKQILKQKPDQDSLKPYPSTEYEYKWGTILSCYDPRSGQSSVIIRYKQ
jgi:hypothetical protein